MSAVSGIFVFIFGAIIGVAWRLLLYMIVRIPYFLYAFFASKFRDPIPEVHGITRRDKSVYFHKDCSKQQIQLIYRQGRRKKVLDTYPWKDFGFIPYSLEWKGENCIIVREYNVRTAKQITEKEYTI